MIKMKIKTSGCIAIGVTVVGCCFVIFQSNIPEGSLDFIVGGYLIAAVVAYITSE